jgi:tetratricopeptide (TPR) repeat protein
LTVDHAPGEPDESHVIEAGTSDDCGAGRAARQILREAKALVSLADPGPVPVTEIQSAAEAPSRHGTLSSGVLASAEADWTQGLTGSFHGETVPKHHATSGWSGQPQCLGDYKIIQEVGRGGMGVVFKVHDVALDRVAALKIIHHFGATGGEAMDRFFRAARLWARLKHPSIVPIYNVGQFNGMPYVVSEFIEGVDLSALVSPSGCLLASDAARIIAEVADALSFAHAAGVIHRDVKPSNIMIKPDGHAVLVDFGLARSIADDGEASLSIVGTIVGTPSYMSPEQAEGRLGEMGPATDVYSLGAALYAVLVGRPPFRGQTVMETLQQIPECEPAPPRRLEPTVPRDLETICLKALAKRPADRYSSARAMAEDLRHFLDGSPIQARAQRSSARLVRWLRRRPAQFGMILLAVASLSLVAYQQFELQEARRRFNVEGRRELRRSINRVFEADLRRVVELGEARVRDQPESREVRRTLASTYHRLGDLFVNTDRLADASWAYERAITLLHQHLRDEARDVASRIELADILCNLGEALWELGQESDARVAYYQALTVNQRLVFDYPEHSTCWDNLAQTRNRLNRLSGVSGLRSTYAPDESLPR